MKLITLLFSLGIVTSLKAMDQAPLQGALTTIAQQRGISDKKAVLGILNPKQCDLRSELLDAQLKVSNANVVHTEDKNGNSLLMQEIADDCNPAIIRVLLKHSANPRIQNKDGQTALHILLRQVKNTKEKLKDQNPNHDRAEFSNYSQTLDLLLEHQNIRSFINLVNKDHESPLIYALQNSFAPEVIEKLFYAHAGIHAKAQDGSSIIHLIARNYQGESRNWLLNFFLEIDQAFDSLVPLIDEPDNKGITPLMEAMFPKNIQTRSFGWGKDGHSYDHELITTLLKWQPNLYAVDTEGQTVLHKILISHKDWLGDPYYHGYYSEPNQSTLIKAREKIVDELLAADTQRRLVNIVDNEGLSPLMIVQSKPNPLSEKLYPELTFDGGDYHAPYSISCLIKKLIRNGANVLYKNKETTPFSDSTYIYGGDTFINRLVKQSPWLYPALDHIIEAIPAHQRLKVLNEPDCNGDTPTINSVGGRYSYVSDRYRYDSYHDYLSYSFRPLKILLSYGADFNSQNKKGKTALECAFKHENMEKKYSSYNKDPNPEWYTNILWKYNPANKWTIFRKQQPFNFAYTIAKTTAGIGLAAYLATKVPFESAWQVIKNLSSKKAS